MKSGTIRQYSGVLAIGQRITDAAVLLAVQGCVWLLYVHEWRQHDTLLAVVALVTFTLLAEANGVYRTWRGARLGDELRVVLWTWVLTGPLLLLWLFATKTAEDYSRVATFGWFLATGAGLAVTRSIKNSLLSVVRARGRNSRTAGIIGATPLALKLRRELADPVHGIHVVGIYDFRNEDRVRHVLGDENLAGGFEEAVREAREGRLDFVYITLPLRAESRIAEAVGALADTTATVQLVTDFSAFDLLRARWASVGGLPAVSLFDTPFNGPAAFIKRLEDLVLGIVLLACAAPVMLAIALAIKITTRGPVFFSQTRHGLGGKPIKVLKFRSMTVADDGPSLSEQVVERVLTFDFGSKEGIVAMTIVYPIDFLPAA
jgi:putative colanic acid biosynthesis UDP-glucose lipid carrier transferase